MRLIPNKLNRRRINEICLKQPSNNSINSPLTNSYLTKAVKAYQDLSI